MSTGTGTQERYQLSCSGAQGDVNFEVEGLPEGGVLMGNYIVLGADVENGNYILRIRATDASGNIGEKIVNLVV